LTQIGTSGHEEKKHETVNFGSQIKGQSRG